MPKMITRIVTTVDLWDSWRVPKENRPKRVRIVDYSTAGIPATIRALVDRLNLEAGRGEDEPERLDHGFDKSLDGKRVIRGSVSYVVKGAEHQWFIHHYMTAERVHPAKDAALFAYFSGHAADAVMGPDEEAAQ